MFKTYRSTAERGMARSSCRHLDQTDGSHVFPFQMSGPENRVGGNATGTDFDNWKNCACQKPDHNQQKSRVDYHSIPVNIYEINYSELQQLIKTNNEPQRSNKRRENSQKTEKPYLGKYSEDCLHGFVLLWNRRGNRSGK